MKESPNRNGGEAASICSGYLGERFNNQFDLAKMLNDIERPDLQKLEYLAFNDSVEEGDLENIRVFLQRYLEIANPIKQFLSDSAAGAVGKAEELLAVVTCRLAPDRMDDASVALNSAIKQTAIKVSCLEEDLPSLEH
ncbi:hypothetical protein F4X86_02545 [Candidatus Saccharibacteria bacterium]|nr:hypothetical protein [Candidatus Saccharibacteria bacterium]